MANIEYWRPIKGYPEYEISSLGNVRRFEVVNGRKQSHIIKGTAWTRGYLGVMLYTGRGELDRRKHFIHRLVIEHFIGPPPLPNMQVNHKDGNKLNNSPANLEWVTASENTKHAYEMGLRTTESITGERNPRAILSEVQVTEILEFQGKKPQRWVARKFNCSRSTIQAIYEGRLWKSHPSRQKITQS